MEHLIEKYRRNELTAVELAKLRKITETMSDDEISRCLQADWLDENEDANSTSANNSAVKRMKSNIDAAIGRRPSRISRLARWAQTAAAVLLPLAIFCAVYFYRENNAILSDEMLVTTGKAERANITLPDGTVVALNAESTLAYNPKGYNKKERAIRFDGEGYFRVHGDKDIPFFVNARGLQVKVLGTVFNLSVRETDDDAELALEEGSVSLLSVRSSRQVVLQKNQKAILNQLTGDITVVTVENIQDKSAWQRGDMVFRNTPLSQVVRAIEENYNTSIKIDCAGCLSDPFTGTLPVNNLNEVLEVIERSYHLKATSDGREIVMRGR